MFFYFSKAFGFKCMPTFNLLDFEMNFSENISLIFKIKIIYVEAIWISFTLVCVLFYFYFYFWFFIGNKVHYLASGMWDGFPPKIHQPTVVPPSLCRQKRKKTLVSKKPCFVCKATNMRFII